LEQLSEVELLDTVPMPLTFLRSGTKLGAFVLGPDRTKLYGRVTGQDGIMEVDVASLKTRHIDVEFGGPVYVNAMVIDGAHNCAIADPQNRAMLFFDSEFKLIKRVAFAGDQMGVPLDAISIQSGGFIACNVSRDGTNVVKYTAEGDVDWECVVGGPSLSGQPVAGSIVPFYGSADSCFLLAQFPDTTVRQSHEVRVVRCESGGCSESPVLLRLEAPWVPAPGSPEARRGVVSRSVGPVMAVGVDGDCLLRYGNRKCRPPVLVRYMAGEEPRVYRVPRGILELLPFDENTFWGRPFADMRSDTLAFTFRIPAWEAGLPFSEFIKGQGRHPGYGIANFPSNDKPNAPDSGSASTSHRVSQ